MVDEGRRPGVPPDPQETTLRSGHTNKIIVNGDSHGAASQPRFSGCVPSPDNNGGGAVVTNGAQRGAFQGQGQSQGQDVDLMGDNYNGGRRIYTRMSSDEDQQHQNFRHQRQRSRTFHAVQQSDVELNSWIRVDPEIYFRRSRIDSSNTGNVTGDCQQLRPASPVDFEDEREVLEREIERCRSEIEFLSSEHRGSAQTRKLAAASESVIDIEMRREVPATTMNECRVQRNGVKLSNKIINQGEFIRRPDQVASYHTAARAPNSQQREIYRRDRPDVRYSDHCGKIVPRQPMLNTTRDRLISENSQKQFKRGYNSKRNTCQNDEDESRDGIGRRRRDEHRRGRHRRQSTSSESDSSNVRVCSPRSRLVRNMKPDKFNGNGSLETFLVQFSNCAKYNRWRESDKAAHLRWSLTRMAAELQWGAEDSTYQELEDKLQLRFGGKGMEERFQTELRCRRRGHKESLRELAQDPSSHDVSLSC